MSRAEIFIWMASISLITFTSTIFLTGIIIDDLVTPTTRLDLIKEIISIFTSVLAIPLTMYGLYIARDGLSTWKKQLKTDKTITALENAMNEADNISSTCWQADFLQSEIENKIQYTQAINNFDDTEVNNLEKSFTTLSHLAYKLQNICDKPLVDPRLKKSCQSLINASGQILIFFYQLKVDIDNHRDIRSESQKPENNLIHAAPERVGLKEIQKIEKTMGNIKSKLSNLKNISRQTKTTLNNFQIQE